MFKWGGLYLNSMLFQTGFAVHTIHQGSDQVMSQTSSSISGKCNNLTLQLCAVSERMEEHVLNFARISPRVSETLWLVFSVWKHWMIKSRHWLVLHSHSISFGWLTVRSLWSSRNRNFGNAFTNLRTTEYFTRLDIGELYERFSTHANFLNRAWVMGIKTTDVCADIWK